MLHLLSEWPRATKLPVKVIPARIGWTEVKQMVWTGPFPGDSFFRRSLGKTEQRELGWIDWRKTGKYLRG